VEAADIELVWEPQWKPEMMSDYAKEQLNMY
jgi:metal-sulfur cluster biosynthetic enzyme